MPAEEQVKAVSKKLMELNLGFDGKLMDQTATIPPRPEFRNPARRRQQTSPHKTSFGRGN